MKKIYQKPTYLFVSVEADNILNTSSDLFDNLDNTTIHGDDIHLFDSFF